MMRFAIKKLVSESCPSVAVGFAFLAPAGISGQWTTARCNIRSGNKSAKILRRIERAEKILLQN